ncbi:MAG: T9SS type A sorting domain-containing protein [Candidatus Zixiibacteriota bacterium]
MRLFGSLLISAALACPGVVLAQAGVDPGIPDTVRVDSVTAFVTGIGIVPVRFTNDENLTTIEVTLRHTSSEITIDSFSFVGGRLDSAFFTKEALINTDSNIVTILGLAFGTPISPGQGLLGKIYLSYSQTILPQSVEIDSTLWQVGPIQHSTSMRAAGTAQSFKPQFIPGFLTLVESPASFDSVWVADVQVVQGNPVALDVFAFNERNLAQIALALDYGSTDLTLDSVTFTGTRSETAPTKTVQPQTGQHKVYTVIEFANDLPLPPGSGVVARLRFTAAANTPVGVIVVDSTTVGIISNTRFLLTPADGSISFVPLFSPGSITVTAATDVDIITDDGSLPETYSLSQNYPNPFNPSTTIELSLPRAGRASIEVFNVLGQSVRTLIDGDLPVGTHRVVFDGRSDQGAMLASGAYFYRLTAGEFVETRKMMLVK